MKNERAVWLEVALNGAAGRQYQPNIPMTPDEIIEDGVACAKGGAAIVHLHAYNEKGEPTEDADIYSKIIEGVRNQCDAIVYPTLALHGSLESRYAPIKILMDRGLLEFGVVDPGSVNLVHRMQILAGQDGFVYPNPTDHIREGLKLAAKGGWRPAYAVYEPGFARLGAALAETIENVKTPIYRVMFSDHLLFGMAPTLTGLQFYSRFLAETAPHAPWMLSGLDAEILDLIEPAIALGAHVRVGLEDASFGSDRKNLDYVKKAAKLIVSAGHNLAEPDSIRKS